jgi:hypothetical protein
MIRTTTRRLCLLALLAAAGLPALHAPAASHSDAPLSKQDPQANFTDVYAFIGTKYDDPAIKVLNVVVAVRPFCEPGDGVMYDRFAPDVLYSIHIADPASGQTLISYDFQFSSVTDGYKNLNTVLSYGLGTEAGPIINLDDARQNYTQTYDVHRRVGATSTTLGTSLLTAIPNVGLNTTPAYNDAAGQAVSGASSFADLDVYTQQAIYDLPAGHVAFAGLRDDGFYSDIPGVFDLLNIRILDNNGSLADGLGQDGGGVDGFKGFNVLVYALQIPVCSLPSLPYNSVFFGAQTGVGVYASASRQRVRILKPNGEAQNSGPYVQVNRMGNPLFNEGLVALRDKDRFNRTSPQDDADFATYAENPELAALINFVYNTNFATSGRTDLVNVFIPEVLRVNTSTNSVPVAGQTGFNRLGFLGGDTTDGISSGWPNGRRLGDDVVDIALTAVASGPAYATITVVGDNVAANDIVYHQVFPYAATPHSGTFNRKDP